MPAQRLKVKRLGMNMFAVQCTLYVRTRSVSYSLTVSLCSWKWISFTHLRQRGERLDMSCGVGLALLFTFIFIIFI